MGKLFDELCSFHNLYIAYERARKGKTQKNYVIEFEKDLNENLLQLRNELLIQIYKPRTLKTFILRDPKTRKISKSDFRDRIIHHAICNIIEPIFEKSFINDSYANRIGKGTFKAIERFDCFKRKVSKNNTRKCFALKADIKHYFETVNHNILLNILRNKICDENVIWLIKQILDNFHSETNDRGMPLGNLTSQFFANVYLNELDQFVKHKLKAKYYIRYVDDFVIMHTSAEILIKYKSLIDDFLKTNLDLDLHPEKTKIINLQKGITFLGFKIFYYHRLVIRKNARKFEKKLEMLKELYRDELADRNKAVECFEGWLAYISHANTYKYQRHITRIFNKAFPIQESIKITEVKRNQNLLRKTEESNAEYTIQKTLFLFKRGLSIKEIAVNRGIKESTVWNHLSQLIEHNKLSLWKVLPKDKISQILPKIKSPNDKLKEIKDKIKDDSITFDEINCVLAFVRSKDKKRNICHLISWYKKAYCFRKCYSNKEQIKICSVKLDYFASRNPKLELTKKEFLDLFNSHLNICILPEQKKREYVSWNEFTNNSY